MTHSATHNPAPHAEAHPGSHEHPRFLAHHFGSAQQQFDAGKFGMWLFLVTEVLFFSGLFCAYAVYRSTHAEAFAKADQYLDVTLGAANTAVLIFSSLTMAWAVRASQLGQKKLLVQLLTITLVCASIFLGVKAVEYSHKWDLGILWGARFRPMEHAAHSSALLVLSIPAMIATVFTAIAFAITKAKKSPIAAPFWGCLLLTSVAFFGGVGLGRGVPVIQAAITGTSHGSSESHDSTESHGADAHGTAGHASDTHADTHGAAHAPATHDGAATPTPASGDVDGQARAAHADPVQDHQAAPVAEPSTAPPVLTPAQKDAENQAAIERTYTGIFFSIYYVMTGLHAIHILAGMGTISWILWRSLRGDFGPDYFGPVDYVGLYWHLVDLIWIYLFPLLYLIG